MKKSIISCLGILFILLCLGIIWAVSKYRMHDFEGKCLLCHAEMPKKDMPSEDMIFTDDIDKLCGKCHTIDKEKSHPINVRPNKNIPLAMHLDKNGRLNCTTCHDVHKEDKTTDSAQLSGLLWGHVTGRQFCLLCHKEGLTNKDWRHQTALAYAHPSGKLTESSAGSLLDTFSTGCLSCHDGTLSRAPQVEVRQGVWQHGIGMSHPIGVEYPRSEEFKYPESLPKEIRLFDGKVGCLSCHRIYGREKNMLVMNNTKSRLCLACHNK